MRTPSGSAGAPSQLVDTGSNHGRCDSGSEVAVGNEADASTSLADIRNQFFVARAFKDNNYQIVNFTVERFGDIPQVIGDRASRSTAPLQEGPTTIFSR